MSPRGPHLRSVLNGTKGEQVEYNEHVGKAGPLGNEVTCPGGPVERDFVGRSAPSLIT